MNNAFMVSDSISPSTQNVSFELKNSEPTKSFQQILFELHQNGEISFDESDLDQGLLSIKGSRLILPTAENVAALSDGLQSILDSLFAENGLSKNPPIEINYSYSTNKVEVTGDRSDTAEIASLINSNSEIKEYVRSFLAISGHFVNIQESLKFQQEYMASENPQAVADKYAYLFDESRKLKEVSVLYGEATALLADGKLASEFVNFSFSGGAV
jgi:hypothetical protein